MLSAFLTNSQCCDCCLSQVESVWQTLTLPSHYCHFLLLFRFCFLNTACMLGGSLAWAPSEFSEIKQRYGSFSEIRTRVAFPLFLLSSVSSVLVLRRASPRLRPTPRRQVSLPRFGALGPHRPMFSSGCDCYLPNFYMNLCVSSTSQILISREDITAENDGSNSRAPWANWSRRMPLGRHWNVDRQWNQRCNIL